RQALKDRNWRLRKGDLTEKRKQQIVEPCRGGNHVITEVEPLADERLSLSIRLGDAIPLRQQLRGQHRGRIDAPAKPHKDDVHVDGVLNSEIRARCKVRQRRQSVGAGWLKTE